MARAVVDVGLARAGVNLRLVFLRLTTDFLRLVGRPALGIGVAKVEESASGVPPVVSPGVRVADILVDMAYVPELCAVVGRICSFRVRR